MSQPKESTGSEKARVQPRLGNLKAIQELESLMGGDAKVGLNKLRQAEIAYYEQGLAFLSDPDNEGFVEEEGGFSFELVEKIAGELKALAVSERRRQRLAKFAEDGYRKITNKGFGAKGDDGGGNLGTE
jgi:hypothetical protein